MEDRSADDGNCLPAGGRGWPQGNSNRRYRPDADLDRGGTDHRDRLRLSADGPAPHGGRSGASRRRGMKIRYFAWMKRMVGTGDEQLDLPADVRTVGDLVAWLRHRSAGHAEALAEGSAFGAAIDRRTVPFDTPLAGATEVAFFPPFTGG